MSHPDEAPTAAPQRGWPVVLLLSGPNLDLLGTRQPAVYGTETLEDHVATARAAATARSLRLEHVQSNAEADLVEAVHGARGRTAAIVVNAGALTHYSWSLADALAAYEGVVVELHLSNPAAREAWRHTSVVAPVANGSIVGFGGLGYHLALEAVAALLVRAVSRERPEGDWR
ncbi:MAG TPA: type II 3-dehydroquinate dehydratase [Acidimicrobiales bacterium]|nr:type II 3-dehydroquinate dehydratase [Acidimicrobiales bacterium]